MVLIVMWFAISQGHLRPEYYPQVSMQDFTTEAACRSAAKVIKEMDSTKKVVAECVPK